MRVLEPPEEVIHAPDRQEVLRGWIDGGMLSISVCNKFPDSYRRNTAEIWGMLISDIFHHVVDAIVMETGRERGEVQAALRGSLEEVIRSDRDTRHGILKRVDECLPVIPDPDVSGDDECVEIVRIVLLSECIRVMVLVGMWLPDHEEAVWGNLLYDIAALIAESFVHKPEAEGLNRRLLDDVIHYIDNPSTSYSGEYYNGTCDTKHST